MAFTEINLPLDLSSNQTISIGSEFCLFGTQPKPGPIFVFIQKRWIYRAAGLKNLFSSNSHKEQLHEASP